MSTHPLLVFTDEQILKAAHIIKSRRNGKAFWARLSPSERTKVARNGSRKRRFINTQAAGYARGRQVRAEAIIRRAMSLKP